MLEHLNSLLCLQFKRCKRVLDYGKIEWCCGIKSFLSLSNIPFSLVRYPSNFKILTRFSEISSVSFIFRYIFRIIFVSNKVFYFSPVKVFFSCHLSKFIFYQKEKRGFIWPKTFDCLFWKQSNFYSGFAPLKPSFLNLKKYKKK